VVRFATTPRCRFSPPLLGRLAKAHTWPATVLVDALDAGRLDGAAAGLRRQLCPASMATSRRRRQFSPLLFCLMFWRPTKPYAGSPPFSSMNSRPAVSPNLASARWDCVAPIRRDRDWSFHVATTGIDDVQGVVQTDQLRSLSWEKRRSRFICSASATVLDEVRAKLKPLLSL
jgi:mRNA-degrading endonuclease toxin of MazEF toxin-antitoxin module